MTVIGFEAPRVLPGRRQESARSGVLNPLRWRILCGSHRKQAPCNGLRSAVPWCASGWALESVEARIRKAKPGSRRRSTALRQVISGQTLSADRSAYASRTSNLGSEVADEKRGAWIESQRSPLIRRKALLS